MSLDPYASHLSEEETRQACNELIKDCSSKDPKFRSVIRTSIDPPVNNQQLGMITFNLFSEPRKLSTGKNVYGFVKLRGNYQDANTCKFNSAKIIREVDSKNQILIVDVGKWTPITDESRFILEHTDVNADASDQDTVVHMRDEVAKQRQNDEARMMRELREREEECKNNTSCDDEDHIDFYTKNVISLEVMLSREEELIKKLDEVRENLKKVSDRLIEGNKKHPEYIHDWLGNCNEARKKVGIAPFEVPERLTKMLNLLAKKSADK